MRSLSNHLIALFFFIVLYSLFFSPVLFSNRILATTDNFNQNLPSFSSPRTLWSPYLFSGYPVAADPQTATWYPLSLLLSKVTGSFNFFIISAYVLASFFCYAYVYSITQSRLSGLFSGTCYGMSGFFMAHLGHSNMIHAACWLPLVLLALEKLRITPSTGWMGILSLSLGCCGLAGHPQIFLYVLSLAACYAIFNIRHLKYSPARYTVSCLVGFVLGISICAILILPFYQLSTFAERARFGFEKVIQFSLPLWQIPVLIFPFLFGGNSGTLYGLDYPGPGFREKVCYFGLLSLILALASRHRTQDRRLVHFWFVGAIIVFLLTLRPATILIYHVPFYNRFRAHVRLVFVLSFAISVLSGIGLKTLKDIPTAVRLKIFKATTLWVTVLVLSTLTGAELFLLKTQRDPSQSLFLRLAPGLAKTFSTLSFLPWKNPATGIPLIVLALGIVTLYAWCKRPAKLQSLLLLLAIGLDLSSFAWFAEWRYDVRNKPEIIESPELFSYQSSLKKTYQRLGPIEGKMPQNSPIPPNFSRLWRLPTISGYNPLLLQRYSDFTGMQEEGYWSPETLRKENLSLDLLCLKYLFISYPIRKSIFSSDWSKVPIYLEDSSRWRRVGTIFDMMIFENINVLPRAWTTTNVLLLKPDQILKATQNSQLPNGSTFYPTETALVEEPLKFNAKIKTKSHVWIQNLASDQIAFKVKSNSPTFLVVSDVYYPGWKATVDGTPTHIYQTDYILRGIVVPEGIHKINFKFAPTLFYVGSWVTGLSLTTILVVWLLSQSSITFSSQHSQNIEREHKQD